LRTFSIGSRGSALALWQAEHVREALQKRHTGLQVQIVTIRTRGDRVQGVPLSSMGDTGIFTKEIEKALLDGAIDAAVHSLKDLPTRAADGLSIAAIPEREDPADALVSNAAAALEDLPSGASVLTGSPRRRAMLLHERPDLVVGDIRGNVETRLRKFDEGAADAILLARAGLVRLGLGSRIAGRLDPELFVSACGQGALAVEIRAADDYAASLCRAIDHAPSRLATGAERAFLAVLEGGCRIPIGAYARFAGAEENLKITGVVASLDGRRLVRRAVSGPAGTEGQAADLGRRLAQTALEAGGQEILDEIRAQAAAQREDDR